MKIRARMNFQTHLSQVPYGMRAMPRTPMRTPLVGVSMLVKPSPNWKAKTVVWRETLMRSANYVMMGMVRAAFAEPLGITRLSAVWKRYITPREVISPVLARLLVSP